jgi:hypothetical protein
LSSKPFEQEKQKGHFRRGIAELLEDNSGISEDRHRPVASDISDHKDFITTIVEKRNKIVDHNDEALDLSSSAIVSTVDKFRGYAGCIFDAICADSHLKPNFPTVALSVT